MVGKKKEENLPCHIKCDMSKRWEFRKPWCMAGLYLSGCTCWSILQIPEAGTKLQPAPALQKHRSSAKVIRAKHTKCKVSSSHLLLMGTEGWDVIFSVTVVLVERGKVKAEHCAKCVTAHPAHLELICFVFEFHCACCSLGAQLEGWLSALLSTGIPCAQPCTSSRVNSPSAHHTPAHAGSLLLHYHRH